MGIVYNLTLLPISLQKFKLSSTSLSPKIFSLIHLISCRALGVVLRRGLLGLIMNAWLPNLLVYLSQRLRVEAGPTAATVVVA